MTQFRIIVSVEPINEHGQSTKKKLSLKNFTEKGYRRSKYAVPTTTPPASHPHHRSFVIEPATEPFDPAELER